VRLNGIYSSILLNDVIRRSKIRNLELLEQIINTIFCNIGKENSTRNIIEGLKKSRHKKNLSLVGPYIKALENAFIIKKVFRCNLSTGKILRTNAKFFIGDHALLNAVIGMRDNAVIGILENILTQDLERREYTVYTGKFNDKCVDFVAKRGDAFVLLQTVDKNTEPNILEQKIEALKFFNDDEVFAAQKKYVIVLDADASFEREPDGVIHYISLRNFLLLETI
jgi:predicted AAA+ superfamily ATPase